MFVDLSSTTWAGSMFHSLITLMEKKKFLLQWRTFFKAGLYSVSHIARNLFLPGSGVEMEIFTSSNLHHFKVYGLNFINFVANTVYKF